MKYTDISFLKACRLGKLSSIKYYLNHGASLSAERHNCLKYACMSGNLESVKYLIEKGACTDNCPGLCAYLGKFEILRYLLKIGISSDNILDYSLRGNWYNIAEYLVKIGYKIKDPYTLTFVNNIQYIESLVLNDIVEEENAKRNSKYNKYCMIRDKHNYRKMENLCRQIYFHVYCR